MDPYMIAVIAIPTVFFSIFWSIVLYRYCSIKCKHRQIQRPNQNTQRAANNADSRTAQYSQHPAPPPPAPNASLFAPPTQPDGTPLPYYVIYVPISGADTPAPSDGVLPMHYTTPPDDSPPKYEDIVNDSSTNRY